MPSSNRKRFSIWLICTTRPRTRSSIAAGVEDISIRSSEEGKILDEFGGEVCTVLGHDHPNYLGRDADINADAQMAVGMISKVLAEYQFTR